MSRKVATAVSLALVLATTLVAVRTSHATFTGGNGLLLYQAQVGNDTQLFTVRPDGSGVTQITHFKGRSATDANWAPGGTRIVFTQHWDPGGPAEHFLLSTINADGTGLEALPKAGRLAVAPNWLSSRKIVYLDAVGAHGGRLMVVDANGKGRRPAGVPGIGPGSACALPGNRVAYLASNPANGELSAVFVSRLFGRGGRRITAWATYADKIDCSPDGRRIVYSAPAFGEGGKSSNVYTMRVDGSDRVQLTHETGGEINAGADSWSPDGTKIAYVSNKTGGAYQIWTMYADGSGATQLTHADDAHLAAWGSHP
jgi:Tol biopolymer transport system component